MQIASARVLLWKVAVANTFGILAFILIYLVTQSAQVRVIRSYEELISSSPRWRSSILGEFTTGTPRLSPCSAGIQTNHPGTDLSSARTSLRLAVTTIAMSELHRAAENLRDDEGLLNSLKVVYLGQRPNDWAMRIDAFDWDSYRPVMIPLICAVWLVCWRPQMSNVIVNGVVLHKGVPGTYVLDRSIINGQKDGATRRDAAGARRGQGAHGAQPGRREHA